MLTLYPMITFSGPQSLTFDEVLDDLLIAASSANRVRLAKTLLNEGAAASARDNAQRRTLNGGTALMLAVSNSSNIELVRLLLDRGADVNARDKNGYTALRWASMYNRDKTRELLIKHGAKE